MAQTIVSDLGGDPEKTRNALQKYGLPPDHQAAVVRLAHEQVQPALKRPVTDLEAGRFANRRSVSEFSRSFVLGLFTFLWFFIVPIPGLLVFTAPGGHRFMMPLAVLLGFAGAVLGVVLDGYGISVLLERLVQHGLTGKGLAATTETRYRRFRSPAVCAAFPCDCRLPDAG